MPTVPLLVSLLVGFLLGIVAWGVLRNRARGSADTDMGTSDDLPLALLVLAAFTIGVFLTYVLVH
jgi:hypothetical protein